MPRDLHPADLAVIVAYLIGITALGAWMGRRVRSVSDYFMPRRFGKAMMITHAFGTGTASDQAVSVAAETFRSGLAGIWWQWVWLPATPFYWLIAPVMRRFRAVTTADVLNLRFDRSVAGLFAVVGIVGLSVKTGLLLKGSGALVESATGASIPADLAIGIVTVLLIIYGTAGGLSAAIVTDFVQGILTVCFSFLLLPFVLNAVGGLPGIREAIPREAMLSLVAPGEIGTFFVVMYSVQALIGIIAQPFIMSVCAAGRTELDNRVGFMVGNILKRVCTAAWCLTALAAVAWYTRRGVDLTTIRPDNVYGDMARAFLPGVVPGLLGLFLSTLLASAMSSCDSYMISAAGLFTENIYKNVVPGRSQHHYVTVGRVSSLLVVTGGVAFAYVVPDVVTALKIWFSIAPMMGIAIWLGLFWRRTTAFGAWCTTVTGFAVWYLVTTTAFIRFAEGLPFADAITLVWTDSQGRIAIYEPWRITLYTTAAAIAGIGGSLLTRPTSPNRLERFYALARTPVRTGEVLEEPCTLPADVEPAPRRVFLDLCNLEIPVPSALSVAGFLLGAAAVAALIASFVWLVG